MNTFLIILAIVLALVGIIGSIVPGLPGPPISWVGILLLKFTTAGTLPDSISGNMVVLIAMAVLAIIITILDYVVPSISTKKHGGSKAGVWGCNIGLIISIVGLPFGPQGLLGVIVWPFVGALVGELLNGKQQHEALRAAWGAFLGFLCGTGLKLFYTLAAAVIIAIDLWHLVA